MIEAVGPTQTRAYYPTFDALRGGAALVVATMHVGSVAKYPLFHHAYLAVDFFFVLSGFVIAGAYDSELRSSMRFRDFAWRRFVRLWPLYALGLAIGVLLFGVRAGLGAGDLSIQRVLSVAAIESLMLPVPHEVGWGGSLYPINIAAWSLFFELVANTAYGLVAPWLTTRRLAIFVGFAAVALVAAANWYGSLNIGTRWADVDGGLARVSFGFFAGVLLHRLRPTVTTEQPLVVLALCSVLGGILAFGYPSAWGDLGITLLISPMVVLLAARFNPGGMQMGIAKWLGDTSYAVYVLHIPLALWLIAVANKVLGRDVNPMLITISITSAIMVIATAADRIWDIPIRKLLMKLGRRQSGLRVVT
jgi:peptidoglycan/LPS O-acetylase OafA/YrhL